VIAVVVAALRDRRGAVVRLALWSLAEVAPALLTGHVTARAVDDGFLAGRTGVGIAWLGVLAIAVPLGALGTRATYRQLGAIVEPFRDELLGRVVAGALRRGVAGSADAAAVARITQQIETVRDTFAGLIMVVRGFVVAAAAALVGLASLSPEIAAMVAAPLVLGLALLAAGLPAMVARQREYVLAGEHLAESVAGAVAGHRDVVASGGEERVEAAVGVRVRAQARAERAVAVMAATRGLCLGLAGWLPVVIVLAAAPWLIGRGLGIGAVLGALVYVTHGLQPALHALVHGIAGGGLRFAVALDRILAADPDPDPAAVDRVPARDPVAPPSRRAPADGRGSALSLRSVTFRYGRAAAPVLDRLDLDVPDGDHLAIVGPSGAGKSTMAALMAGVEHPQAGVVWLAGAPVERLGPAQLARRRVLIPQEAYVFGGTLRENLSYLCPGADPTPAVAALGLGPLVDRLGDGPIDPATLSAGERQLIALARAYLSPAPLVILDEATCHLDPPTEARAERAFADRGGTLIVIAHRISSALRARRVLLLEADGARVDTHDGLLARSSTYRDLVGHWSATHRPPHSAPITTPGIPISPRS
jgi:ABC-type multidrug transport system fused ATPase/permease subunit